MSKEKLNMDDLDKVSGGYITGTVDGEALKVTGGNDSYQVTLGSDSGTYSKQEVTDFVKRFMPDVKQEDLDTLFSQIESDQEYNIGDW
jgi:murein endopeptidase